MNLSLWDSSVPFLIKGNKMAMTYEELVNYINSEKTGIAKGYNFQYLRDTFSLDKVKKIINNDLKHFEEIERTLLQKTEPIEGDWVKYDGGISRLSRIHSNGSIQLSENIGVYVCHNGSEASGCTWDSDIDLDKDLLKIENLIPTNELKEGKCWMFSELESGGGRGVYHNINFRVWELKGGVK
ncbi:hypothetical protein [Aliarcobacter butzleri]|uniref:hypothetical protein n=1 Tax=Aliarcobacter butzleri TaxID=28197 RepID=UPI0021B3BB8C|nr:hypothetical protein [Aliarcobacter butzleri]MCT7647521.1 hypothetical protein [Aliarcobacter butzleri]